MPPLPIRGSGRSAGRPRPGPARSRPASTDGGGPGRGGDGGASAGSCAVGRGPTAPGPVGPGRRRPIHLGGPELRPPPAQRTEVHLVAGGVAKYGGQAAPAGQRRSRRDALRRTSCSSSRPRSRPARCSANRPTTAAAPTQAAGPKRSPSPIATQPSRHRAGLSPRSGPVQSTDRDRVVADVTDQLLGQLPGAVLGRLSDSCVPRDERRD